MLITGLVKRIVTLEDIVRLTDQFTMEKVQKDYYL